MQVGTRKHAQNSNHSHVSYGMIAVSTFDIHGSLLHHSLPLYTLHGLFLRPKNADQAGHPRILLLLVLQHGSGWTNISAGNLCYLFKLMEVRNPNELTAAEVIQSSYRQNRTVCKHQWARGRQEITMRDVNLRISEGIRSIRFRTPWKFAYCGRDNTIKLRKTRKENNSFRVSR